MSRSLVAERPNVAGKGAQPPEPAAPNPGCAGAGAVGSNPTETRLRKVRDHVYEAWRWQARACHGIGSSGHRNPWRYTALQGLVLGL